jgi:Ca2+-transporting ATPase
MAISRSGLGHPDCGLGLQARAAGCSVPPIQGGDLRHLPPAEALRVSEDWHDRPLDEILAALGMEPSAGLPPAEATRRLAAEGPNELRKGEQTSPLTILAGQFRSVVIWILIGAALVSGLLGEVIDSVAILAIVVLNAAVGFLQEYRAERAVAALARMTAPRARVVRGGRASVVPASEVVRGDVLLLEGGDLVAADARLLDASLLRTTEAALTGESEPVEKEAKTCARDTPLADRRNMVFLGTSVASGTGRAVVVATGMATEVGRIAALLASASRGETPLQRRLDRVGRRLLWACLAIVVVVFALGLARSTSLLELFMGAVSLAVAAIPEGLPAVVTVALALGVQRMARRNALVRRLPAVETLGSAEVVCTDKTGTLTVGEMTVRKVVTSESVFDVTGEGYETEGGIFADSAGGTTEDGPLRALLTAAVACNDAELTRGDGRAGIVGDPTEAALLVLAAKGGLDRATVEAGMPRLGSVPFDSDRKRMTIVRRGPDGPRAFVKGAPEVILERCDWVQTATGLGPMTDSLRGRVLEASTLLAHDALRVLAFAERALDTCPSEEDPERGLTLLGLVGMQDPPRAEAREAVARCKRAGIRTVMITGDHPDTARAIGRELGILAPGDEVLVGQDLDQLNDEELALRVRRTAVYARVTAEHKLRVVRAWKAARAIVAMTGDGVNDAPALKEASIGIAMGITGTEVTKEAADVVIADDNFASIVAAVEEGRGIYDNIAKTLGYLLAGNGGELVLMLVAGLVGWPLPLLPIQLLWINLVTDGLPALGLATDPIDAGVLARPPRRPDADLMDRRFLSRVALTACIMGAAALVGFGWELAEHGRVADARNAAFSVLVFAQLMLAFGVRSERRTVWELGLLSNLRLFAIVAATFALQLAIHHIGVLQVVFGTQPMSLGDGMTWLGLGCVPFVVLEMLKLRARRLVAVPGRRRLAEEGPC